MISSPQEPVADQPAPPSVAPSNGELLGAFVREKDEAAFACLVRRHGPMVFGVCKRLLGNEHDAADAFQAAFLVLARKAATIRAPEVLGTWLYNVAYRVSIKARSVRLKRAARERQVSVMPEPAVECPVAVDDLAEVLDEELRALPAKHQAAIVLCDLEGYSRKEAAATLKVAEGTVSSRLAYGRQRLAARLRRRGVVVSATALAVTLGQSTAGASVPAPLVLATVKAAVPTLAGQAAAGLVSAKTMALVDGVMNAMLLAKLKLALLAILGLCALGGVLHVSLAVLNAEPDEEAQALATLNRLGARLRWETIPAGKRLVMVDLGRTQVQDEHLKVLRVFTELRELWLNETAVTDAACEQLVSLQKLRALHMNGTKLSDAGAKRLAALAKLEVFAVGWTKIGDSALKDLAALVQLRELDLRHTGVSDAGLIELAAFRRLHTLELGNTGVTDAGLRHFTALPELLRLRLENTAVTDRGLKDLAASTQLEALSLDGNQDVTDAGLSNLLPLERLSALNLSGTRVTDAGVPELAQFKQLRTLMLDRTAVTGAGFADAAFQLTTLWLNESKVTDAGLRHVAALTTVQRLLLERTAVSDAGVRHLVSLQQLDTLSLDNTKVTDACAGDLAGFKRLWSLNLSGTKITDTGLGQLAPLTQLHWLALHNTAVTDAGVKHLAGLQILDTLWLSWTKVSEAGLKDVAALKRLQTLRLGGLKVTDDGLKDLAPLKNLHTLWLDWTKITDAGLKELAAFKRLEELRLDGTSVTGEGLKALAALKHLQRIELQETSVNAAAVTNVKTALPQVTINTRPVSAPEPEPGDGPRSLKWIVIMLGGLTLVTLVGWLVVTRRRVGWRSMLTATAACAALGILLLAGRQLVQGDSKPLEAAGAPAPAPIERVLRGHTGPVHGLCFTPDGRRLVSASGWPGQDKSVRIWDLTTDKELYRIRAPGQFGSLVLSADGRYALAGAFGVLFYIDVETGELVKRLKNVPTGTMSVAFAADGRHVYSGSQDGFARRWDLHSGTEVARFRVPGKWTRFVGALPGGRLLTADNAGVLQTWDVEARTELKRINAGPMWVSGVALVPGNRQLLIGSWSANLWDLEAGTKLQAFQGHKGNVHAMTLSPDGKTLLTAGEDGTARLWDFESGAPLRVLMTQEEFLFTAAYSRDGRWIAAAGGGRKHGDKYDGGVQHDIHIFEMPAPTTEPALVPDSDTAPWFWIASLVGLVAVVVSAALLLVRRKRHAGTNATTVGAQAKPNAAPAAVSFSCSTCGKKLRAKQDLAGKKVKCPVCGKRVLVPHGAGGEYEPQTS